MTDINRQSFHQRQILPKFTYLTDSKALTKALRDSLGSTSRQDKANNLISNEFMSASVLDESANSDFVPKVELASITSTKTSMLKLATEHLHNTISSFPSNNVSFSIK